MADGAPAGPGRNRCDRTGKVYDINRSFVPVLPRSDNGLSTLRRNILTCETDACTSAHLLQLAKCLIMRNSLAKQHIDESGRFSSSNPQIFRFHANVSDHPALSEHRQFNQGTGREENKPVHDGSLEAQEFLQEFVGQVNDHAETLGSQHPPKIRALYYHANCPNNVGIGEHSDRLAQHKLYPEASRPLTVIRVVHSQKHSALESTVTFKTYRGAFAGAGVSKMGPNKAEFTYTEFTRNQIPISTHVLHKEGSASTYANKSGAAGFTPLGFWDDSATALMTAHEVKIENRDRGAVFCIIIDYVFDKPAEADAAFAAMETVPLNMVSSRIPNEDAATPIVAQRDEILAPVQGVSTPTLINLVDNLRKCKNCSGNIASTYLPMDGVGDPHSYELDLCNSCAIRILDKNKLRIDQGHAGLLQRELPVDDPCVLLCGRSSVRGVINKCRDCARLRQCKCDRGPVVVSGSPRSCCIDCLSEMECSIKGCDNKCCIEAAKLSRRLCEDHHQEKIDQHNDRTQGKRKAQLVSTGAAITTKTGKIWKRREEYTRAEEKAMKRKCLEQWELLAGRYHPPKNYNWTKVKAHKDVAFNRNTGQLSKKIKLLLKKDGIDTKKGHPEKAFEKYRRTLE
eukprot:CAMPEP_0185807522 /NCGR_PEP_ID=MMETSP1322-20130828/5055_1 /TAXON_ID=265543 /ORGANISM="Minutocellus polymorphus, Strain RCC2270" /LENGTH=624 /DNA_ID=CAMNT_0028503667 /DNA_START=272 /DNA_END=2146 /DNA_ORIENTATION=+